MIKRLLIASLGALTITIGLFLFMDYAADRFVLRDATKYFTITDFIPAPDRGRQLPTVRTTVDMPPERPEVEYEEAGDLALDLEPAAPEIEAVPLPGDTALTLDDQTD